MSIISRFFRTANMLLWTIVALIIIAYAGRYLLNREQLSDQSKKGSHFIISPPESFADLDSAMADSLRAVHTSIEAYASSLLDGWIGKLTQRLDQNFLTWYFSYWTQQKIALKGLGYSTWHYFLDNSPTGAERIAEDIQTEFAARVLIPELSNQELESIVIQVSKEYVRNLNRSLEGIREQNNISKEKWEKYSNDLGNMTSRMGIKVPFLTKVGVTISAALAAKLQVSIGKALGKLVAKAAGKSASKIAAKTGTKILGPFTGPWLGPFIAIVIIIWDIWDNYATEEEQRPILRSQIIEYFSNMKYLILMDPEGSIMSTISEYEEQIISEIKNRNTVN